MLYRKTFSVSFQRQKTHKTKNSADNKCKKNTLNLPIIHILVRKMKKSLVKIFFSVETKFFTKFNFFSLFSETCEHKYRSSYRSISI